MNKKMYTRAKGGLYLRRLINITDNGIALV